MKKAIFLLLAIGFTSFSIYSCQKDTANKAVDSATPNIGVTDRYTDCDECYQDCYDCCLTFTRNAPGNVTFVYVDNLGVIRTVKMTSVTAQTQTVCACAGYLAILAAGGSGTITPCDSGIPTTRTGVNKQGSLSEACGVTLPL